jgi:hypothetical protein
VEKKKMWGVGREKNIIYFSIGPYLSHALVLEKFG